MSPALHPPERPSHTHSPKPAGFGGSGHEREAGRFPPALSDPGSTFLFFGSSYTFVLCRLHRVVCRGFLEQHFRQYSKLGQRGFCIRHSLPYYWRLLVIFCVSPCDSIISSSGSVIGDRALCAGFFSVVGQHCCSSMGFLRLLCCEVCLAFVCAFYFFRLSASHDLRLGMDGMLLAALCDHGFERSGFCVVNNNNNKA